jgi:hypothetical protein
MNLKSATMLKVAFCDIKNGIKHEIIGFRPEIQAEV